MADLTQAYAALQKADAAGDTAGAQQLAAYIKSQGAPQQYDAVEGQAIPTGSPAAVAAQSPVSSMPSYQRFAAGYGAAGNNLVQGLGQDLGLVSRQDVANTRATNAPLMATSAGKAGDIAGSIVDTLPAAAIPGANTLAGAAGIGAAMGFAQPSTSTSDTLLNTGLGGLVGPASILAGRGAAAVYQGGKAVIEPLFQGGQQRVAARALQTFAGGPAGVSQAVSDLGSAAPVLPGVQPTTAELANNGGLAQFERSLRNNPEYLTALTNRNQSNRAAMTGALDSIAGTDSDMQAAQQVRSQWSGPMYQAAGNNVAKADGALVDLLARPSMQSAWKRASQLAAEQNEVLTLPAPGEDPLVAGQSVSGKTLQYLKMGLNDLSATADQKGMGAHEQNALNSTISAFNGWTQKNLPGLRDADQTYAAASNYINQMDIGRALSNKLKPALTDFGNNTRLNANSYAGALRNGDQLAANATGMNNATLGSVLSPDQMTTINQIGQQLARRANADELGRAVGSNTGQNLLSQNVLRQMLGPLGLPESMAERATQSTLGQSVLRPVQWLTQAGQPKVMDIMANSALDPVLARRLLMQGINPSVAQGIWTRQGILGAVGSSGALAYASEK